MEHDKLRTECAILAQTFEIYLAYYLQSSAKLFAQECRDSAKHFLEAYEELARVEPNIQDPRTLRMDENTDVNSIVTKLRVFAEGSELYPYPGANKNRLVLWEFFSGLKGNIFRQLEIKRWPIMTFNAGEALSSANFIKWSGYLPRTTVWGDPDSLVEEAGRTPTIALVGDIRRSQDLMTYGKSPAGFSNRMVRFVETTRYTLEKYGALFDKFTGDGFIAYFNETICRAAATDYLNAFISFLAEYLEFAGQHFQEWTRQVKRLPVEPIGLALGADLGIISFQNLNQHLFAVGDAIVWASRLASAAGANEVLVNNLLFEELSTNETLTFQQRSVKTKTGDDILARVLSMRKN